MSKHNVSCVVPFTCCVSVLGCGDYQRPGNTWVKRDGDVMTLGCVSTGQQWKLTCQDQQWVGDTGDCLAGNLLIINTYWMVVSLIYNLRHDEK